MKERSIPFSAPMVRALLDGRKTQTRRVVKPGRGQRWLSQEAIAAVRRWEHSCDDWWAMAVGEPNRIAHCGAEVDGGLIGAVRCPYGQPGDRLWVRETWYDDNALRQHEARPAAPSAMPCAECGGTGVIDLDTRCSNDCGISHGRCRCTECKGSGTSRITLEVTDVRVERLQDISQEDAIAEGVERAGAFMATSGAWQRYTADGPSCEGPRESFRSLWESIHGPGAWTANPWVWAIAFKRVTP